MNNPFDFFDEIHLINLDSRPEKWEDSKKELDKVGILERTQRFSAIHNPNGAIGCAASNVEVIKLAKERNLDTVLILEDDVNFEDNCLEVLEKSLQQLDGIDFGFLYLGINPLTKMKKVSKNLVHVPAGYTTHSYAVHKNLFDTIINNFRSPIDVYYASLHRRFNNCYCTFPLLAGQRKCWSDIENVECDNGAHIKERFYNHL